MTKSVCLIFADDDEKYLRSCAFDGNTKSNHFRKCAQATKDIKPNVESYFSSNGAEEEVTDLLRHGNLNLKSYVDTSASTSNGDPSPDDYIRDCSSSLHCARPIAQGIVGPCDLHGIVGGVCSHSVPLKGMFVDMHGPEQFVYYLVLLKHLIKACVTSGVPVKDVYVDFACRLAKTWDRFRTQQPQHFEIGKETELAKSVRVIVNWMHGSSHDLSCQLQNNGRYTQDAGRKHGEGCEQMWSLTKPMSTLIRYMKHCHRREWLEGGLSMIACDKLSTIVKILDERHKVILELIPKFTRELASIQESAVAADVQDIQEAMDMFKSHILRGKGVVPSDDEVLADYAELLMMKDAVEKLRDGGTALAVIDSAVTSKLMGKAYSENEEKRIDGKLRTLERAHSTLKRWPRDSGMNGTLASRFLLLCGYVPGTPSFSHTFSPPSHFHQMTSREPKSYCVTGSSLA